MAPAPAIAAGHALLRRTRPQVDGFPVLQKGMPRLKRAGVAVDEKAVNLSRVARREKGSVRKLSQIVALANHQSQPLGLGIMIGELVQRNRPPAVLTVGVAVSK